MYVCMYPEQKQTNENRFKRSVFNESLNTKGDEKKQCSTFSDHVSLSTLGNPDAKQVVAFCGLIGTDASPVALSLVLCQHPVAETRFRLWLQGGALDLKGQAQSPLL